MNLRKSFLNIIFWSVVSAAFIGPGTITTAAKTGSLFGTDLLWTLLFATFACFILQDAASRITILSGKNLGQAMYENLSGSKTGKILILIVAAAIYSGGIAYETGNLIGSREGLVLIFPGKELLFIVFIGLVSGLILFIPSLKIIARIMGIMVMILGISFLIAAFKVSPGWDEIISGLFKFKIPENNEASLLILGLIGTTIVPYNLFLGSGISKQTDSIPEMRSGLLISIILGGIFSMAVLVVGTAVQGEFSFNALAIALSNKQTGFGEILLGTGLFAAGFTSGITAPLAAAITFRSLFGKRNPEKWTHSGIYFRISWIVVLAAGIFFALLNIKPIPAIILAQALNGLILPLICFFLVWLINNRELTGVKNSRLNNIFLSMTLALSLTIGLKNLISSFENIPGFPILDFHALFLIITVFSAVFTLVFMIFILRKKRNDQA